MCVLEFDQIHTETGWPDRPARGFGAEIAADRGV
jgi:hypothetical protein